MMFICVYTEGGFTTKFFITGRAYVCLMMRNLNKIYLHNTLNIKVDNIYLNQLIILEIF